eukprot:SAG31_NODE_3430_length_4261_cov_2.188382_2_plen_100_part_00
MSLQSLDPAKHTAHDHKTYQPSHLRLLCCGSSGENTNLRRRQTSISRTRQPVHVCQLTSRNMYEAIHTQFLEMKESQLVKFSATAVGMHSERRRHSPVG